MKYHPKPNQIKKNLVASLTSEIQKSKAIAVVDYTGMKVSQATALRQSVKKAGGKVIVAKNTLFKIASGVDSFKLTGLPAFILSQTDEVSAIKAVSEFSRKNGVLKFTGGLLGDKVLSANQITELASVPPKEVLVAKMLGSVKSPLYGLANALNWNISKLVRILDAIARK